MSKPLNYFLLLFSLAIFMSCKEKKPTPNPDYLGVVNIEITGAQEALPHFEKGLLLLP